MTGAPEETDQRLVQVKLFVRVTLPVKLVLKLYQLIPFVAKVQAELIFNVLEFVVVSTNPEVYVNVLVL